MIVRTVLAIALVAVSLALALSASEKKPVGGPFGLSQLTTSDGKPVPVDQFYLNESCGLCHVRQLEEMTGSMHSVAHIDSFYRAFAELARKEAGDAVYGLCSGCHTPAGVVSGLIPGKKENELPEEATAGVTCDVCHLVSDLTGEKGPFGEPGNASIVLSPGLLRFGNFDDVKKNPAHTGRRLDFYSKSEFCASCHTVIHPTNGLRIEHTYAEWKGSVYAEKGIQCQDCHMQSVEDAIRVAETLTPVKRKGAAMPGGPEREIHPHFFVGGNVDAARLGGGEKHGKMAEARLKSAARIEVVAPAEVAADGEFALTVKVTNVAAGHNLPTSLTELRQMWVHLRVVDDAGRTLFESGATKADGSLPEGTIRFGAETLDKAGKVTMKPWEAVSFKWKRLIPPRASVTDVVPVRLEAGETGKRMVVARLLYRIAPPSIVREVMGEKAFVPTIVEMTTAETTFVVR